MSKKKLILLILTLIVVIGGAYVAYTYFFMTNDSTEETKVTVAGRDFTSCDDQFVSMYTDSVYGSKTRSEYAAGLSEYAEAARKISRYESDINCVYISYEGRVYSNDAPGARQELEAIKTLIEGGGSVNSSITSFVSIETMEQTVANLEHNQSLEASGEEVDGRG